MSLERSVFQERVTFRYAMSLRFNGLKVNRERLLPCNPAHGTGTSITNLNGLR